MDEKRDGGLSRRDALKRGAVVASAAWIAPAVMALPVSSASADSPSGTSTKPKKTKVHLLGNR